VRIHGKTGSSCIVGGTPFEASLFWPAVSSIPLAAIASVAIVGYEGPTESRVTFTQLGLTDQ